MVYNRFVLMSVEVDLLILSGCFSVIVVYVMMKIMMIVESI